VITNDEIRESLSAHIFHTYMDFMTAIQGREFPSMHEVWEEFVAFQVEKLEKHQATRKEAQ